MWNLCDGRNYQRLPESISESRDMRERFLWNRPVLGRCSSRGRLSNLLLDRETKDGVELTLRQISGSGTTPLLVRLKTVQVVQQILEANLPDQLSGAHDGLERRILPPCIPVRRTRLRRFARHMVSVLCWPQLSYCWLTCGIAASLWNLLRCWIRVDHENYGG